MGNSEIKNKIYGKVMNSVYKYATLEGICFGMELMCKSGGVDAGIVGFTNDLMEIVASDCSASNVVKALREYAEKHPWN